MADELYGDGPICVAVLICTDVIEDKRTKNKSPINTIMTKQLGEVVGIEPISLASRAFETRRRTTSATFAPDPNRIDCPLLTACVVIHKLN